MDYITDNYLDKGFQNMLLPFRCLNHLMFLSRFSIEYNCIRPNKPSYYMLSFAGVLAYVIFHSQKYVNKDFNSVPNQFIYIFIKVNIILLIIPYFVFFALNIVHKDNHVRIFLKIQKAFRIINYKRYKLFIIWNWFGIFRHFAFFVVTVSVVRKLTIAEYFYTLIFFDVHVTYGISIITLIRDGAVSWIAELERHGPHGPHGRAHSEVSKQQYNDKMKKLFQAYINLMEAYQIYERLFRIPVLFLVLDTFFHTLLYVQMGIELSKTTSAENDELGAELFGTLTVIWASKNVAFVLLLSIHCEVFYMSVSDVNDVCSRMLGHPQCSDEGRKLCKNVKRYNRSDFSAMSACGVFALTGRLPHQFVSLVVNYTVVLLQFALLSE